MSEEKKMIINKKDFVACNYFKACDYFKNMKRLQKENKKLKEVTNEAIIEHENLLINSNDFAERAEKLEQENKELKAIIERLGRPKLEIIDGDIAIQNLKYKKSS